MRWFGATLVFVAIATGGVASAKGSGGSGFPHKPTPDELRAAWKESSRDYQRIVQEERGRFPEHLDHDVKLPAWSKSVLGRMRQAVDPEAELAHALHAMWTADLPLAERIEHLRGLHDDPDAPGWVRVAVDRFIEPSFEASRTPPAAVAPTRSPETEVVAAVPVSRAVRIQRAAGALFVIAGSTAFVGLVMSLADQLRTDRVGIAGDVLLGVGVGTFMVGALSFGIGAGIHGRHRRR
jgi:hypothetical protein